MARDASLRFRGRDTTRRRRAARILVARGEERCRIAAWAVEYPSSFRIGTAAKIRRGAREVVVNVVLVIGAATRPVRLVLAPFDGRYRIANFLFPGGGSPDLVQLLASGGH